MMSIGRDLERNVRLIMLRDKAPVQQIPARLHSRRILVRKVGRVTE